MDEYKYGLLKSALHKYFLFLLKMPYILYIIFTSHSEAYVNIICFTI